MAHVRQAAVFQPSDITLSKPSAVSKERAAEATYVCPTKEPRVVCHSQAVPTGRICGCTSL
eukprot:2761444-Amphidinium_carterae.1